jgi:RNA polymerase sigma-70 factor (ECF subfamily)
VRDEYRGAVLPADRASFDAAVTPLRAELRAHCYRLLGSVAAADDALLEALLGAWRGLAGFEGRSSLKTWLYRIATNACLQLVARRPKRLLANERTPAARPEAPIPPLELEPVWLEPYPDDPAARLERRETIELAFVAALQHLPPNQRAALLLCEVVGFTADAAAAALETSVAAVNSALARARATMAARLTDPDQQTARRALGRQRERELVDAYVTAWERRDVEGLVSLLTADAKFTMPPLPIWFDGRDDVARFFAARVFATAWELRPMEVSGQLAFACYQGPGFALGAINVVTLRGGAIAALTGFLDPALHRKFLVPQR